MGISSVDNTTKGTIVPLKTMFEFIKNHECYKTSNGQQNITIKLINTLDCETLHICKSYETVLQAFLSQPSAISAIYNYIANTYSDYAPYIQVQCNYPLVMAINYNDMHCYANYENYQSFILDYCGITQQMPIDSTFDSSIAIDKIRKDYLILKKFDEICEIIGENLLPKLNAFTTPPSKLRTTEFNSPIYY